MQNVADKQEAALQMIGLIVMRTDISCEEKIEIFRRIIEETDAEELHPEAVLRP